MIKNSYNKFYRDWLSDESWNSFTVSHKETDLLISIPKEKQAYTIATYIFKLLKELREGLDAFILKDPIFLKTLEAHSVPQSAPLLAQLSSKAAQEANVGPMAAIAGALAQIIGERVQKEFALESIIIENGGDIYLATKEPITLSIYAGDSPLSNKIALEIQAENSPLGICTSSGTVGHALSFGQADAVTVLAKDAALADAFATRLGNVVKSKEDIERVLEEFPLPKEILGLVLVVGDQLGVKGDLKLVPL